MINPKLFSHTPPAKSLTIFWRKNLIVGNFCSKFVFNMKRRSLNMAIPGMISRKSGARIMPVTFSMISIITTTTTITPMGV